MPRRGINLLLLFLILVRPVAAETTAPDAMGDGDPTSLTDCLIACALNPVPTYELCAAACYIGAMNAGEGDVSQFAEWLFAQQIFQDNTDLDLLAQAAAEAADLQQRFASSDDFTEPLALLVDTFTTSYWDDDRFVRNFVDTYFVSTTIDLLARSRDDSGESAIAVHAMLVSLSHDTDLLARISPVGKVGVLGLATQVAGAEEQSYLLDVIASSGLTSEVNEFNARAARLHNDEFSPSLDRGGK